MSRVIIRSDADADLDRHADYIAKDSVDAALRLFDAVEQTYETLARMPGMGTLCETFRPPLNELRRFAVKRYPNHIIYYRPLADGIEVHRLLHAAQDRPGIIEAGE